MSRTLGVPFESNPPPDHMPDLDLEVGALPLTRETGPGPEPPEPKEKESEDHERSDDE